MNRCCKNILYNIHFVVYILFILITIFFYIFLSTQNNIKCYDSPLKGYIENIQNISIYNSTENTTTCHEKIYVKYSIPYYNNNYVIKCILQDYIKPIINNTYIGIYIEDNIHICHEYIVQCDNHVILKIFVLIISILISCFTILVIMLCTIIFIHKFIYF